jgi:hypothetical protein
VSRPSEQASAVTMGHGLPACRRERTTTRGIFTHPPHVIQGPQSLIPAVRDCGFDPNMARGRARRWPRRRKVNAGREILPVWQGEAEGTGHGGRNDAAVSFAVENPFNYIQVLRVEDDKPIREIGSSGDHTGAFVTGHSD